MFKKFIIWFIFIIKSKLLDFDRKLSDGRIIPKLIAEVHVIEKEIHEEKIDFLKMVSARNLFFETKRRNLLSSDQENWCNRVLFGKYIEEDQFQIKKNDQSKELTKVIKERRSVRSWLKSEINNSLFEELIEASKWAPSSCNRQPWHFILTKDRNKIELIYKIKGQNFLKEAPYCFIVLIDKNVYSMDSYDYFSGLDAGAAIQNLLLRAEDLNIGACWVNWSPHSLSDTNNEILKRKLNIPSHMEIISIIALGQIKNKPLPPGRKDTKDILHIEQFDK